jgi:superfamily II DNA/RNA helicase
MQLMDFNSLNLPATLLASLNKMNFVTPTPIQQQAIPSALEGKDILGSAQTGTGKTAAFAIPLITKLIEDEHATALIMTPTRELAMQVIQAMRSMLETTEGIKSALLIGGESIHKQLNQLAKKPRIVVGTPGRINDHLTRKSLKLNSTKFLVLDETDRMLDMGFTVQIEKILKYIPQKRQTLLFSATMPKNIVDMAAKYLNDPVHISIGETSKPAENIQHKVVHTTEDNKYVELLGELENRKGSIIIFVKTKRCADKMADKLKKFDHDADAIHGDLRHNKRERVIKAFRNQKCRILVATDIAARGLDIPHIEHVINYDLPQCPEDYIHRIGRTARAGAEGSAMCFITPANRRLWPEINKLMDPDAPQETLPSSLNRKNKKRRRNFRFKKKFNPKARS